MDILCYLLIEFCEIKTPGYANLTRLGDAVYLHDLVEYFVKVYFQINQLSRSDVKNPTMNFYTSFLDMLFG